MKLEEENWNPDDVGDALKSLGIDAEPEEPEEPEDPEEGDEEAPEPEDGDEGEEEEGDEGDEEGDEEEEDEKPKKAPKKGAKSPPKTFKAKVRGEEVKIKLDNPKAVSEALAALDDDFEYEIDPEDEGAEPIRVKRADLVRNYRTYEQLDRREKELEERAQEREAKIKALGADPVALLRAVGEDDPEEALIEQASLLWAERQLETLEADPDRSDEKLRQKDAIRIRRNELKDKVARRQARARAALEAHNSRAKEDRAHWDRIEAALPGALHKEGLDEKDPVVKAMLVDLYRSKRNLKPEVAAARVRETIGRTGLKPFEKLDGAALLKALPKGLRDKIRKAELAEAGAQQTERTGRAKGRKSKPKKKTQAASPTAVFSRF